MDCKNISKKQKMDDYILGNLSDKEKETFEQHIFECESCFQELRFRKEMMQLIQEEGETLFAEFLPSKEKTVNQKSTTRFIIPHRYSSIELLNPVYLVALLFIVIIAGVLIYQNFFQKDFLTTICYDEKVPYEYKINSKTVLRSSENAARNDAMESFRNKFITGMLEYKDRNYKNTINALLPLLPEAKELISFFENKEILSIVRDYYFYLGVSYLAIARSEQLDLTKEEQNISYQHSSELISISRDLASANRLSLLNRDFYFLALVYGYVGDKESAISQLQKIDQDSPFYPKAKKLKNELKNN